LEYIRGLRKTLETKKAEIVGEDPSTIPGAEHDAKPDPNAKKPDPEVKDQTMVPNSGLTIDGAGDDSKITHTNDLTAEQAALTPTKKPEVTDDADAKTAEKLAAEIITGVDAWYAAKKEAEAKAAQPAKTAADGVDNTKPTVGTPPSAGTGTAEALITDTGKEPEQTKDAIPPTKKPEVTADATVPATGEGSSGETAAAAKEAAEAECCKDGKCGKCAKCKAAATAAKKAGALDMELTSDVLAKIAAVMLATEEGTKLAESLLSKAAGAEAAEKTLNFLRDQNDLAQKQAEFEAGQRDALVMVLKKAAAEGDAEAAAALAEAGLDDEAAAAGAEADDGITEIADTLDAMVESGEITEDEADQVVLELAQALSGDVGADAADESGAGAADAAAGSGDAGAAAGEEGEAKTAQAAQAVPDAGAAGAAPADAGNAAIDQTVAPDPSQLDPNSVPQGGDDITVDDVADALDTLVQSGEITEDEADQLVQEIVDGDVGGAEVGAAGGEDVSPEAIATALQDAVASGELKPEEVQQVLTELEGVPAPVDGAVDAAAAPAASAAPAAPAAAVAPADEAKTAGAKLMAAINAARAAKAASAAK
jgi:polyhydroxyalkanoate synthesis regulator phasin